MSDISVAADESQVAGQNPSLKLSGGAMLRKAREAAGLHIAALAVSLKVPVKKLEALEADRFDLLPDMVFVRALASSVCRTLKIDPSPILENLPHTEVPRLRTDEAGINAPFRATGDVSGLPFWSQLSKPVVWAVILLLIGVAVLVFFPFSDHVKLATVSKSESVDVPVTAVVPSAPPMMVDTPVNVAPVVAAPTLPETVVPSPVLLASAAASAPALPASTALAVSAFVPMSAAKVAQDSVPSGATLVLKARASSWVEVIDGKGAVQTKKILTEGEVVSASGPIPLSIVVGRADAVEVQVRGKPMDLSRIAKDNVARFEVK